MVLAVEELEEASFWQLVTKLLGEMSENEWVPLIKSERFIWVKSVNEVDFPDFAWFLGELIFLRNFRRTGDPSWEVSDFDFFTIFSAFFIICWLAFCCNSFCFIKESANLCSRTCLKSSSGSWFPGSRLNNCWPRPKIKFRISIFQLPFQWLSR